MGKPTIAESGWNDFLLDSLRETIKASERTASDLAKMRMCDHAGCGRMFDGTDPRSRVVAHEGYEYNFCPGCELQAQAAALPIQPST